VRNNYAIREYHVGDEGEINDLFNLVFKQNRSLNGWHWEFRDNPAGDSKLIALAEVEGKIVGQHSNVPVYFRFKNETIKAAQSVDHLVHPGFRGGKIIRDTYRRALDLFAREGVSFAYGFPNQIYYPFGKRMLRYNDLCPLPTMFKRLNWRLAFKKRIPSLLSFLQPIIQRFSADIYRLPVILNRSHKKKLSIQRLSSLGSEIDNLWEMTKDRYGIMAIRDRRFLKWRYLDNPHDSYEIFMVRDEKPLGYVVTKISKKGEHLVGYIVDILSADRRVDNFLIGATLNYFISRRVDYSLCRILKEDDVYNILLDYGFEEKKTFPATPVIYQLYNNEMDPCFFKDPGNWHLTYGDQIDAEL
jgi:hypothetical protein